MPSRIWSPPSPIISHSLNGVDCAVLATDCWWVLGGRGHWLAPGREEERSAPWCPVHLQTPHHFISGRLDSHGAPSSPTQISLCPLPSGGPPGAFQECKGAACKGATYVIEHFVQLLGIHDEVGVAYHVVDRVRLGRRDTKDSGRSAGPCGCRAQGRGPGKAARPLPTQGFHGAFSCLTPPYPWDLCLNVTSPGKLSVASLPLLDHVQSIVISLCTSPLHTFF